LVRSTERVVVQLLDQVAKTPGTADLEAPTRFEALSPTPLTTPFPPDYPPGSGSYKTVVIDGIAAFGISGASNTNRCDASDWGGFVAIWWPLNKAFDTLDGACVVAGCDPIGIGCAITCGILEAAKIALKIAAVPLELCDVHQSAIDGAEIEAIYENTLGLVGDVSHVHDDLTAHDTNIDTDLAAHDTNIDTDLAAHDTNIDGDLQTHDADIKGLLGGVQDTLDNEIELRRVHLQVLEIQNRQRYLVSATEAGAPVDVDFLAIEVFDAGAGAFANLVAATTSAVESGVYVLELNLSPQSPDKIFRIQVRHDDVVDHFGQILFHRVAGGNLGMGQ
jgi:hypothetical protein